MCLPPPIEFAQEEAPVTSPPQVADATAEDANVSESPSWDSRDYMSSKSELEGDAEQLDALDGGTYEQCAQAAAMTLRRYTEFCLANDLFAPKMGHPEHW